MNEILNSLKGMYFYIDSDNIIFKIIMFLFLVMLIMLTRNIILNIFFKIGNKMASKTKTDLDNKILDNLKDPIKLFYTTILIFFASFVFKFNTSILLVIFKIVKNILAFSVFWGLYNLNNVFIIIFRKSYNRITEKQNKLVIPFLEKIYKIVIYILGFTVIIQEWYDIGAILAGLGIGGLALALAAKDTASNIFSSIVIILDRTFDIGDYIEVSNQSGIVEDIGFRSTKIRTLEDAMITIPNSKIGSENILNWSKRNKRKIKFNIGVTYDTSNKDIENIVEDIRILLKNDDQVETNSVYVYMTEFKDSSLNIFIQYFVKTIDYKEYLEIKHRNNLKIIEIVNSNNSSIAYNTLNVLVNKE